jgi:hypothetical protein
MDHGIVYLYAPKILGLQVAVSSEYDAEGTQRHAVSVSLADFVAPSSLDIERRKCPEEAMCPGTSNKERPGNVNRLERA